jgi:anti-anti-sigma factor
LTRRLTGPTNQPEKSFRETRRGKFILPINTPIVGHRVGAEHDWETGMAIQNWSKGIWVVPLVDGPDLADDLKEVAAKARADDNLLGIVLDLSALQRLSSASLTRLLHIRKATTAREACLKLTALPQELWTIFKQTGLDKLFDFSPDVSMALAALQLESACR